LKTVRDTGLTYASNRDPRIELGPDDMMMEERAEGMDEALIRQEYLCDFAAAQIGSIYGELMELLIAQGFTDCKFVQNTDEVFTAWDLGKGDKTAIWFFSFEKETRFPQFIDYYENSGKNLKFYFDLIDAWEQPDLTGGKGYKYAKHWLPHDAKARTLASEVSVLDQFFEKFSHSLVDIVPSLTIDDGIAAGRRLLQQEGIRFHARCAEGVLALSEYQYGYDEEKKCFTREPQHDWASDGADAFRYASIVIKMEEWRTRPEAKPKTAAQQTTPGYYNCTIEELFQERETRYRR